MFSAISDLNTAGADMDLYFDNTWYQRGTGAQNMFNISEEIKAIHDSLNADGTCTGDAGCAAVIAELAKHIIDDTTFTGAYTADVFAMPPIASGFNQTTAIDDVSLHSVARNLAFAKLETSYQKSSKNVLQGHSRNFHNSF